MDQKQLFELTKSIWDSFSHHDLEQSEEALDDHQVFGLQWLLIETNSSEKVLVGLDPKAAYGLASDMFERPVQTLSVDDERDAFGELAHCVSAYISHEIADELEVSQPKLMRALDVVRLLHELQVMAEVMSAAENRKFYIAVLKPKDRLSE